MRIEAFYVNPRLTALLVLFVVVMGGMAYSGLARQEDPTMTERWARVTTFMPGATAERMESLISEPIETALREVPEVKEITSTSKAGSSVVGVELYDSVQAADVQTIWSEIRDELGDVAKTLPVNASEPELIMNKPLASTVIVSLAWNQDSAPELTLMSRVAESLRVKLANLPGTEEAEIWGEAEEEVLVALDPNRLADANLTAGDVAGAIRGADTKLPSGRMRGATSDLLVEVDGELSSPERIARIPLLVGDEGAVLRVSDVATVRKHELDPPRSVALHDGNRIVLVNAKMQPGLQIESWSATASDVIEQFREDLPTEIALDVVYDQNVYTGERMQSLGYNLMFALVIVLVALIWFMGMRSALTVGIALPLSAAMVLFGMQVMNIPLHQMSVTGLIIALGLLIDNAIVVVEGYKLRRRDGDEIPLAIRHAIRHLVVPLGASTATTVFAFMPIAMSPGGVGDFTGTLGITVALSVVSSFILAMTVVPAISGFLDRRFPLGRLDGYRLDESGERWWQSGYSNERLRSSYERSLRAVVRKPSLGIAIGCALPIVGFALMPTLTQQFFPPVDRNQFQVQLSLPAHASIADTERAVAQADQLLRSHPEITDSFWTLGEGAPRVFYNVVSLNERISSFASAWVNTSSAEATQRILKEVQADLSAAMPAAEVLAIPFEQGPPRDAPVEVRLVGPDFDVLRSSALELRRLLAEVPDVTYTRATLSTPEPKLTFIPDENKAAFAGLSTGELSRRLNSALSGELAGTLQEANQSLPVRVRVGDTFRDNVSDLESLPLLTGGGEGVPLEQLGRWSIEPVVSKIERRQGDRISTVQGFLVPFALPAPSLAAFRERIEASGFVMPAGYRLEIGGEAEQSAESVGNIASMFVFFALAMAVVVILSLNSFRQGALIGGVAILSFGLALFGVRLFGYPFGYMALIGALGMMGLAINGSIIVLSALKASDAAQQGDGEKTVAVVVDSTRHIVSTTATTIGGFVPLIVAGGTFWPPLATAIAGGVGGSALIALYLVPAAFVLMVRGKKSAPESVIDVKLKAVPATAVPLPVEALASSRA